MNWIEALLLGIVQGLTEFLPVSSSGHLEIGKALLGIETSDDLLFTVVVHGATVLSTIVVFWKEIVRLFKGFFKFKMNEETDYVLKIFVSMIPVMIVGLFFKDYVESLFESLLLVGCMLLLTALLLTLATYLGSGKRDISYRDAFIIGLAQCLAVLPGLSRSGTTIATGLLLGNKKDSIAQFSFLMVLIPILGEAFLQLVGGDFSASSSGISAISLALGTLTAFVSGYVACRWMIRIVQKARLRWFALYCVLAAAFCFIFETVG